MMSQRFTCSVALVTSVHNESVTCYNGKSLSAKVETVFKLIFRGALKCIGLRSLRPFYVLLKTYKWLANMLSLAIVPGC